jgi:ankyrin repeat protein
MRRAEQDRRKLRFTLLSLLLFTGIAALLVAVWLPRIRDQIEERTIVEKYTQIASATARLFSDVERQASGELALSLSLGADPDARAEVVWDGRKVVTSALNLALRNADYVSVQMLLNAGANPNFALPQEPLMTVLQCRIEPAEKKELVLILLEAGASLTNSSADLMLEENLPDAAAILQQHDVEYGIREMCLVGDFGSLRERLQPPLIGKTTGVRNYHEATSLLGIALLRSHTEIAAWLLKSGASTDVGDDHHKTTALHLAAVGNCVEMLSPHVLAGCDINAGDFTGDRPLNYAIPGSKAETISALIALGAEVKALNKNTGEYPIHQAARRYYVAHSQNTGIVDADRIVLELIAAGADENQRDANGRTATDLTKEFQVDFEKLIASGR